MKTYILFTFSTILVRRLAAAGIAQYSDGLDFQQGQEDIFIFSTVC
jgi:hypothetical protein